MASTETSRIRGRGRSVRRVGDGGVGRDARAGGAGRAGREEGGAVGRAGGARGGRRRQAGGRGGRTRVASGHGAGKASARSGSGQGRGCGARSRSRRKPGYRTRSRRVGPDRRRRGASGGARAGGPEEEEGAPRPGMDPVARGLSWSSERGRYTPRRRFRPGRHPDVRSTRHPWAFGETGAGSTWLSAVDPALIGESAHSRRIDRTTNSGSGQHPDGGAPLPS
jgi:hypothetical protein